MKASRLFLRVVVLFALSGLLPGTAALANPGGTNIQASPVYLQGSSRTFPETGKTVSGRFLDYWNTHGGLAQQGFPISDEFQEKSDIDGKTYTVQYFERAVFEYHPENPAPNEVLLQLLGVILYGQKYPQVGGAPNQNNAETPGSVNFPQTGKRIGGVFLAYWNSHGSLAQQGFPISNEFQEKSDVDGKTYRVQYFERAVFEYHPEFQGTANEVLLSLAGSIRSKQKYPNGIPSAGGTGTSCSNTINVAAYINGGSIAGQSSNYGGTWDSANLIDGKATVGWAGASGAVTNQFVIVDLPGGNPRTINKVRLNPAATSNDPMVNSTKDFEIRVSATTTNTGSFTTVYKGTAPQQNTFVDITFNAVQAKYVMLFVVNNYGGGYIEAAELEVYDACTGGTAPCETSNLALASTGGRIAAASSEYGGSWAATELIDGSTKTGWASASGKNTNQYLIVALPALSTYTINRVRLNPSATTGDPPANNARDFEIRVSTTTTNTASFTPVYKGTAPQQNAFIDITFDAVQARYVMLFVANNYGGSYVEAAELEVYDACTSTGGSPNCSATTNVALVSNGATVVGASSNFGGSWDMRALNDGTSENGWASASGQVTNQYVIIDLQGIDPIAINHARLNPSATRGDPATDNTKDFEIRVSATTTNTASFTTVYKGTAPQQNAFIDITFQPVQAKYVMLFVVNNYGGSYVEAAELEVYRFCEK